jgi:uncharacterized membrane protein YbaN (DUF454 family)
MEVSGSGDRGGGAPYRAWARWAWLALGLLLTGVGIAGVILPLLPGTIFLILAAGCFARSSPRLEGWLLAHPRFGPAVAAWRRDRAIPLKAKLAAFAGMSLSLVVVSLSGAPAIALLSTAVLIGASALYVATRPSGPME